MSPDRRTALVVGVVAAATVIWLILIGSGLVSVDRATAGSTTSVTGPTSTAATTSTPTTAAPRPAAAMVPLAGGSMYPTRWFGDLVALSDEEVWATVGPDPESVPFAVGHLRDGVWAYYATTSQARILDLAAGPDGVVWAATDDGLFAFDGGEWTLRFSGATGGVAVGSEGVVWIAGHLETPLPTLWLARWAGGDWERVDPDPDATPVSPGRVSIALTTGGTVWAAHQGGVWIDTDLIRFDGAELLPVAISVVPDETPNNQVPAVLVRDLALGASGELWALGYLAADPSTPTLLDYDLEAWTLHPGPEDWPAGGPALTDLAVGPDGTVWIAVEGGLHTLTASGWATYLIGADPYLVDVTDDGTVWYATAEGFFILDD